MRGIRGKNVTMESITLYDKVIEYEKIYRRVKHPRLEFKPEGLKVILPFCYAGGAEEVICTHGRWVYDKARLFESIFCSADILLDHDASLSSFQDNARRITEEYSRELRLSPAQVVFRAMRARWGSCDCIRRITLNKHLRFLPENCIRYVIYHEVLHMVYRSHGKRFRARLRKKFPDGRKLDKLLFAYDLRIRRDILSGRKDAGSVSPGERCRPADREFSDACADRSRVPEERRDI